jgi:hypothetical protein
MGMKRKCYLLKVRREEGWTDGRTDEEEGGVKVFIKRQRG